MTIETVAVTGGNGKIGTAIIAELNDHGYTTVNLARGKKREGVSDSYITTDLLDAGQVYGSLAKSDADAVIHMGTIPNPRGHPGYLTYESNVMSSYHVLEAATELGLKAACLASSINAMGGVFQDEPMEIGYLPVDEEHSPTPRDPYATSKHALEVTADGFGRLRDAPTISTLRYPWVMSDEEIETHLVDADRSVDAVDPEEVTARDDLYSYLHISDAASIARLAIEADYDGHERFWAVAADTTMDEPTADLAARYYPDAEVRGDLSGTRGLIDISKAERILGWAPTVSWHDEAE